LSPKHPQESGPFQLLPQRNQRNTSQYHNHYQHIEYNRFVKTAIFFGVVFECIFGVTHLLLLSLCLVVFDIIEDFEEQRRLVFFCEKLDVRIMRY
jgi:hypothetical protein